MSSAKELYYLSEHRRSGDAAYLRRFLSPLGIAPGASVLDVGCGTGFVGAWLAAEHAPARNLGLDIDPFAIGLARQLCRAPAQPQWFCATAEKIPLGDACVDHVVCRVVLPYCDIPVVIREFARVVRPNGTVVLGLHRWDFYLRWLSLRPSAWRRSMHGLISSALSVYFNVTGRHVRFRWRGRPVGQTAQTIARMRRLMHRHNMRVYAVVRRPELILYARRD